MKNILLILFIVLGMVSCKKEHPEILYQCLNDFGQFTPNEGPFNGKSEFVFYPDKRITISEEGDYVNFDLAAGNMLVFKYEFKKNDNPNIADDEYGEAIYFQVKPTWDSFHISSDDLEQVEAVFGRFCFCIDGGYHKIHSGCIHGEKISKNKWKVSFSLQVNTTHKLITVMIDEVFIAE